MAFRGRAPKDPAELLRKNQPAFATVYVEWDGQPHGPDLPDDYPWCMRARVKWEELRRTPQSMLCIATDWEYLTDTWLLYDRIWANPSQLSPAQLTNLLMEYRRRMGSYGFTFEDRQKQRIQIHSPYEDQKKEEQILAEAEQAVDYFSAVHEEVARRLDTQE